MGRIISLANQKGGVGKTTTTINLGAALAELGRRVLIVDFDPQGAASVGLGLNPNELDLTVYNIILDRSTNPADAVVKTGVNGLSIIPANIDLSAAEVVLVSEVAREQTLKRALGTLRADYDEILIDCPPSLGLLTINALTASDSVLLPLECEYFALRGMALLLDTIEKVQDRLNPDLQIEGIIATMYDGRTIHAKEVLERVRAAFGERLLTTMIPRTIRFAEAPVAGQPILAYASDSKGAQAYRRLAKEVLGIVDDQESEPAGSGRAVPLDLFAGQAGEPGGGAVPADSGGVGAGAEPAGAPEPAPAEPFAAVARPDAGAGEAPRAEAGEWPAEARREGDVLLHEGGASGAGAGAPDAEGARD